MTDKDFQNNQSKWQDNKSVEYTFIFILFIIAFCFTLLAFFIIAWACDFFAYGPDRLPDGFF